jgi:glycosyltransferase involved in cell wall biosynthesis
MAEGAGLRVLWVGHFVPWPPRGGAPQRSFNLLREASAAVQLHFAGASLRGHQPSTAAVDGARRALEEFCASVRILALPWRSSRAGKLAAVTRCLLTGRSYSDTWLDAPPLRQLIAEAIRSIDPDVVHVDSVMVAHLLPPTGRWRAVLNHHNVESHMMERRSSHARGPLRAFLLHEARRLRRHEQRTAGRFVEHLTVSPDDAERLRQVVPGIRCTVIANGVDVDYFRPLAVERDPDMLVFAGRMNWYPNEHGMIHFLDRLWPELKRRMPRARLTVAGMHPTRRLLDAARADPAIRVTGFVEDIRPVIRGAAVYVCPILDGGGTRLKLLDAMALAMPIVATPVAVEGLPVADGRHALVRPADAAFVDAIAQCLGDPAQAAALGHNARELVLAEFAWSRIGRDLLRAYERAGAGGPVPAGSPRR